MRYTDEQKRLAQRRNYPALCETIDFLNPNPFSEPDLSQTSLLSLCLDLTGNLSMGNIENASVDIIKKLLSQGATLHEDKRPGKDKSEVEQLSSAFASINAETRMFGLKKYFIFYGLITDRVQYSVIGKADLAVILKELKIVKNDRALKALILSLELSLNQYYGMELAEESVLASLLSLEDAVYSFEKKQNLFNQYLKCKCSKGLDAFVVEQINKAFLSDNKIWQGFFTRNATINYSAPFVLQAKKKKANIRYQNYLVYLLSPSQEFLFQEGNGGQLFNFIFEKLHQQSPGFHNAQLTLPGESEARHPLAWLMMHYNFVGFECLFRFVRQNRLNLHCRVLNFDLAEKEFGQLEDFLQKHCSGDKMIELADRLHAHFMGEGSAPIYRSLETQEKRGHPEVAAIVAVDDERQEKEASAGYAFPLIPKSSGLFRKRRVSGASSYGRGRYSELGQSGEGLQHSRRSSASSYLDLPGTPGLQSDAGSLASVSEDSGDEDEARGVSSVSSAAKKQSSSAAAREVKVPAMEVRLLEPSPEQETDSNSSDPDSEDGDAWSQSLFEKNPSFKVEGGKKYVVLARGLHFYRPKEHVDGAVAASSVQHPSFFSKSQRIAFRSEGIANQDSMAVRVCLDKMHAVQTVRNEYSRLSAPYPGHEVLRDAITAAEYESPAHLHQQVFSNSTRRYEKMIGDEVLCKTYLGGASFLGPPFVSTTPRIREAIRYALGDKFSNVENKAFRLRPRYDRETARPKYPHSGILYLFAFTEEALKKLPHNVVMQLYAQGKAHIDYRIVAEEEVSFVAQIPKEYILARARIRFPRFDQPYHVFLKEKYGLTPEKHAEFKQKIQESARGTEDRRKVKREITKLLLAHLEEQVQNFVQRELGMPAYHRLDTIGIDERGLQDEPINLPVARLYRQFHLSQPYVTSLCEAVNNAERLQLLKRYMTAWNENKVPELHLLRLLVTLSESTSENLERLKQYQPQETFKQLILFAQSEKSNIHLLQRHLLENKFKTQYQEKLKWLEDLFSKSGKSFEEALSALEEAEKQSLRQLRTFKGIFTGATPAAILLRAYEEKEDSGVLAVLWDEQVRVPRGRAAGAHPGDFHLEKAAPTQALELERFTPIELPEAVTEILDVETLKTAIRLGQVEAVESYLDLAEKIATEQANDELKDKAADLRTDKTQKALEWKKYQGFLGEPVDKRDTVTPLHLACGYSVARANLEIVNLLLQKKIGGHQLSVVIKVPETQDLPLHLAAASGALEIIKKILKTQHNHNPNQQNVNGDTPLHLAAKAGHLSVVKRLLSDATSSPKNKEGKTPGSLAREAGHEQVAKLLLPLDELMRCITAYCLEANSLLNRTVKQETQDALLKILQELDDKAFQKVAKSACEAHKYVVACQGDSYDSYEKFGCTISYLACRSEHLEIVSALMKLSVDLNFVPNRYERSHRLYPTFLEAVIAGREKVITLILARHWTYLYSSAEAQKEVLFHFKTDAGDCPCSADAFRLVRKPAITRLLLDYHERFKSYLPQEQLPELEAKITEYVSDDILPESKRRKTSAVASPDDADKAEAADAPMNTEPDHERKEGRKRVAEETESGLSEVPCKKSRTGLPSVSGNQSSFYASPASPDVKNIEESKSAFSGLLKGATGNS